jgi:hypothetical protein
MKETYEDMINGGMRLVHHGHSIFSKSKFKTPVSDPEISRTKPKGGLWTSPAKSTLGWIDIVKHVKYIKNYENYIVRKFYMTLKAPVKRVAIIRNEKDLKSLPTINMVGFSSTPGPYLDYLSLRNKYDAIWMTKEGLLSTESSVPINTHDWDCESVLILNPYCIEPMIDLNLL